MRAFRGTLLILIFWAHNAFALTPLGDHTLSVAQAMSAFYMITLTSGDSHYEEEYKRYAQQVEKYFVSKENDPVIVALQAEWQAMRGQLRYDFMAGAGWVIPQPARQNFRDYLTKVYRSWVQQLEPEPEVERQLEILAVKSEVINARFFDVTSVGYTNQSLDGLDQVAPTKEADLWLIELKQLERLPNLPFSPQVIDNIAHKWRMLQRALIKYSEFTSHFLIYYNKQQIKSKLMLSRAGA